MFRTFLAQVWYDKAVWEENKWNDEILHSFTAVLQINYHLYTLQSFVHQKDQERIVSNKKSDENSYDSGVFFRPQAPPYWDRRPTLCWHDPGRRENDVCCFFVALIYQGNKSSKVFKIHNGDFKMVTLLQHLYNKKESAHHHNNTSHRSVHILLVRLRWHVLPLGSTLKWSSRLVTNSSKLPCWKDRIQYTYQGFPTILVMGHQKNQTYVATITFVQLYNWNSYSKHGIHVLCLVI